MWLQAASRRARRLRVSGAARASGLGPKLQAAAAGGRGAEQVETAPRRGQAPRAGPLLNLRLERGPRRELLALRPRRELWRELWCREAAVLGPQRRPQHGAPAALADLAVGKPVRLAGVGLRGRRVPQLLQAVVPRPRAGDAGNGGLHGRDAPASHRALYHLPPAPSDPRQPDAPVPARVPASAPEPQRAVSTDGELRVDPGVCQAALQAHSQQSGRPAEPARSAATWRRACLER
mmetsp:Transcript_45523/g.106942  ORF Transcript_45523/g.106942 Transcript_45523/m.106942 type:complete len:235 (-) Transcript_45523:687-1391(-)